MTFKVIIAGGRDFSDYSLLKARVDAALRTKSQTHKIVIISGKARGADSLGERYAAERGYEISAHPADWEQYGKAAGYRRNAEMAQEGDALIAFWDGKSRGTKHMIDLAEKHGCLIRIVNY